MITAAQAKYAISLIKSGKPNDATIFLEGLLLSQEMEQQEAFSDKSKFHSSHNLAGKDPQYFNEHGKFNDNGKALLTQMFEDGQNNYTIRKFFNISDRATQHQRDQWIKSKSKAI